MYKFEKIPLFWKIVFIKLCFIFRDLGSTKKVGADGIRGTLAGFLEVRLSALSGMKYLMRQ